MTKTKGKTLPDIGRFILTDRHLLESDFGPPYQYCEVCSVMYYAGEEVMLLEDDSGEGYRAVYCLSCGTDRAKELSNVNS
jgi:hypothetical protein